MVDTIDVEYQNHIISKVVDWSHCPEVDTNPNFDAPRINSNSHIKLSDQREIIIYFITYRVLFIYLGFI
jgi:hypothetical protein